MKYTTPPLYYDADLRHLCLEMLSDIRKIFWSMQVHSAYIKKLTCKLDAASHVKQGYMTNGALITPRAKPEVVYLQIAVSPSLLMQPVKCLQEHEMEFESLVNDSCHIIVKQSGLAQPQMVLQRTWRHYDGTQTLAKDR